MENAFAETKHIPKLKWSHSFCWLDYVKRSCIVSWQETVHDRVAKIIAVLTEFENCKKIFIYEYVIGKKKVYSAFGKLKSSRQYSSLLGLNEAGVQQDVLSKYTSSRLMQGTSQTDCLSTMEQWMISRDGCDDGLLILSIMWSAELVQI